jgi:hypothetical protein
VEIRNRSITEVIKNKLETIAYTLTRWIADPPRVLSPDPRTDMRFKELQYCLDTLFKVINVDFPALMKSKDRSRKKSAKKSMQVTKEGMFFAGQYFDALQLVNEILQNAQQSITIIDRYINEDVLNLLTSKRPEVEANILTKYASPALTTAANAFNKQYGKPGKLCIRISDAFHDRFVIVDDRDFYHFGASIKDLGHRSFMFSRIEEPEVVDGLRKKWAQDWQKATIAI